MEIGFGDALLVVGLLLTVAAALSGVMRGTVLSISILGVTLGIVLALADVVTVHASDASVVNVITVALLLTLFADGLIVEGELLGRHWGPPARALAVAMPITLLLLAVGAHTLFTRLSWAEAFLLGAVLAPTDPVVTSAVVTSQRVPAVVRHTLNLESGLNDGLALPFVLFFLAVATPGIAAGGEGAKVLGEAAFGAVLGVALGVAGGRLHHHLPGGGITRRYEGLYAVGIGLAAYGVAEVTFGNGLIAAFVTGIVLGAAEHDIPRNFVDFSENVSAVFQVVTFFIFGALIVATGYHQSIWRLVVFVPFALLVARPAAVLVSMAGTRLPRPQRLFISWFGPKGVASVLFALLVLDRGVEHGRLIFDVAAFVVLSSILAHGLTDTVGAHWIERRMRPG
ncbi:MAG TPA: sodium:proton antiporter [Solirubrobacterales bacterium]|nr:sodium:proton antiporter [Solirubrobacterales bacterium]